MFNLHESHYMSVTVKGAHTCFVACYACILALELYWLYRTTNACTVVIAFRFWRALLSLCLTHRKCTDFWAKDENVIKSFLVENVMFCLTTGKNICICGDSKGKLKPYGTILYYMSECRPLCKNTSAIFWLVSLLKWHPTCSRCYESLFGNEISRICRDNNKRRRSFFLPLKLN